jgi:hypothetical protein
MRYTHTLLAGLLSLVPALGVPTVAPTPRAGIAVTIDRPSLARGRDQTIAISVFCLQGAPVRFQIEGPDRRHGDWTETLPAGVSIVELAVEQTLPAGRYSLTALAEMDGITVSSGALFTVTDE